MKLKTKIEISSLSLHDALPISTVFFDPNLNNLYLLNPDATMNLLKAVDDEDDGKVQSIYMGMQPNERALVDQLLGPDVLLNQTVDSWHDYNYSEQRFDIE